MSFISGCPFFYSHLDVGDLRLGGLRQLGDGVVFAIDGDGWGHKVFSLTRCQDKAFTHGKNPIPLLTEWGSKAFTSSTYPKAGACFRRD